MVFFSWTSIKCIYKALTPMNSAFGRHNLMNCSIFKNKDENYNTFQNCRIIGHVFQLSFLHIP